ncbi:MAG TPA: hypothetical protein VFD70_28755, partial [Anaerolineae bacterium]|nr:hypothetical protein [Anaerolineae bacterium]
HGFEFKLTDEWSKLGTARIRLKRRIILSQLEGNAEMDMPNGFQFHLALQLRNAPTQGWQFFVPAKLYGALETNAKEFNTWSDDRLPFPHVLAYQPDLQFGICIQRAQLAQHAQPPARPHHEARFLQQTDIGSLGFSRNPGTLSFHAFLPYYEGETSIALNSSGTPPCAFYPLTNSNFTLSVAYEIQLVNQASFADALLSSFKGAAALAQTAPPALPFSLRDAIAYRTTSLERTYREWGEDGAAFFFNFNPEGGYDSPSTGFGTSFNEVEMEESQQILEYGFTGRQLNAAYTLARTRGGEWFERGRRTIDFFARHCATENGWLYTIYHIGKRRPLFTVGDPNGRVMHYLAVSPEPANYLRMMVEAAFDLLLNVRLFRAHEIQSERWLEVCRRFADFLLEHQNADGSWYRAYTPEGKAIRGHGWFGEDEAAAKSATAIPISYLLALADEAQTEVYRDAARRAGEYVLYHNVAADHYQGGTLDNPNVVDKEAALYAMHALLSVYDAFDEPLFLKGAERAAQLAVTWNFIWNVPHVSGTRLARAGVESTGWGAINSIWGGGVGDIYTLFFLADLCHLAHYTGEPFYAQVAEWVAHGTQQLLSYPGDLMGFADIGMQPEGIGLCNQGVDEGLIAKGGIWGSLGWIYSAGIFGLGEFLKEKGE